MEVTAKMYGYRAAFVWSLGLGVAVSYVAGQSTGVDLWVDSGIAAVNFGFAYFTARQRAFHGLPEEPIDHEVIA